MDKMKAALDVFCLDLGAKTKWGKFITIWQQGSQVIGIGLKIYVWLGFYKAKEFDTLRFK